MTIALKGDRRSLDGPNTTVADAILDKSGDVTGLANERTEYHRPTGYSGPVWVVGSAGAADLLLVADSDAARSELPRARPTDLPEADGRRAVRIPELGGDLPVGNDGRVGKAVKAAPSTEVSHEL